jgi:hypothetical protein
MKLCKAGLFCGTAMLGLCVAGAATIAASAQQNAPAASPQSPVAQVDSGLPMPASEIIRKFAENESQFKMDRDNYTYSQSVLVEASTADGRDGGRFQQDSDIVFTPEGKRYEKVTYAPQNTLQVIQLTPQDMKDLESVQPFVLTSAELPKYNVQYEGKEHIDTLDTYRFNVAPKKIEKDQRYFQGTIWVDDHDLAIVKSDGKAVPDIVGKGGQENRFPRFVTYRENIEANFWFPTYTHADDIIHFSNQDVRIQMTVRYKNYKRFGSTVKIGPSTEIKGPPDGTQPAPSR